MYIRIDYFLLIQSPNDRGSGMAVIPKKSLNFRGKDAKLKIAYFMPIFNYYSYFVKFPFEPFLL